MTPEEYADGVRRTISPLFHPEHIPDPAKFITALSLYFHVSEVIDEYRRAMFYGKSLDIVRIEENMRCAHLCMHGDETRPVNMRAVPPELLHGILGMMTEGGEMSSLLIASMADRQPFDYDNFFEESGDMQFYHSMGIQSAAKNDKEPDKPHPQYIVKYGPKRWSLPNIWKKNMAKLRARYPKLFTKEDALNRDKDAEQKALGN